MYVCGGFKNEMASCSRVPTVFLRPALNSGLGSGIFVASKG